VLVGRVLFESSPPWWPATQSMAQSLAAECAWHRSPKALKPSELSQTIRRPCRGPLVSPLGSGIGIDPKSCLWLGTFSILLFADSQATPTSSTAALTALLLWTQCARRRTAHMP